jgi:outer membrane receptor protein involved in Fe transport
VAPDGLNLVPTQFSNPLYEFTNRQYEYVTKNLLLGWKARYQISKLFSAEAAYSIQRTDYQTENYYPVGYETLSVDATKNNGYYEKTIRQTNTRNAQFQFNYNQKVGDFDLSAAFKSVYEYEKIDGFSANGYNLTAPVKSLDITDASTRSISSVWQKTVNYGYFLNFKGSWKDKWYLDVLGRLDKSSRFGSDVSWAFFPRVSLAYRLTQDFKLGPVNELKLRVAYGEAGSLPPYGAKDSRVTLTNSGGVSFTQNANTNLKRAITSETELGFDAVIWNWLNVQFNYAFAYSKNDFISVPSFTPLQGSATIYDNLGKVKSNSLELEVSGRIINSKNFSWDAGLTFSRVRSEITDMGDIPAFTDGDYRRDKGLSTSTIWGYGIFTSLNQLRTNEAGFVTNAGDGTKTLNDYMVNSLGFVVEKAALGTKNEAPVFYVDEKTGNTKVIGDAQPDFTVGFTNTLTYGPFSLYASLDWKKGGQKYNETVQYLAYVSRSEFDDKAAKAGLPLTFATQVFNAELPTDYWVEDAGYLSLRELSLSYNIPVARLGLGQWIKKARFALLGRNLFILTKFTGVNVDGDDYDGSAGTSDFFNYPSYRTLSAKLTIDF